MQIGSNGIQAYASGAKTFVPASNVNAHTASVTLGNGSTASASILNGSSAGEVSKTLNNVLSDIGAISTAYTIVDLKNCLLQENCPEHAQSGFGPKGDKQCEYAELLDGMKKYGLI